MLKIGHRLLYVSDKVPVSAILGDMSDNRLQSLFIETSDSMFDDAMSVSILDQLSILGQIPMSTFLRIDFILLDGR